MKNFSSLHDAAAGRTMHWCASCGRLRFEGAVEKPEWHTPIKSQFGGNDAIASISSKDLDQKVIDCVNDNFDELISGKE